LASILGDLRSSECKTGDVGGCDSDLDEVPVSWTGHLQDRESVHSRRAKNCKSSNPSYFVLRGEFGPEREVIAGRWKTLLNEVLHDFYPLTYIIRTMRLKENEMVRAAAH
jgi:hypothetical protein